MTVEWSVSGHARTRIRDRHGVDFDPGRFTAEPLGIDGLRLWTDADGRGLLVREDSGTGWATNTVVSAYSADMVERRRAHDRRPFVPMPFPAKATPSPLAAPPPRTLAPYQVVLVYLAACAKPRNCAAIAKRTSLDESSVAASISKLAGKGWIERVSKTKRTWECTESGLLAGKALRP